MAILLSSPLPLIWHSVRRDLRFLCGGSGKGKVPWLSLCVYIPMVIIPGS